MSIAGKKTMSCQNSTSLWGAEQLAMDSKGYSKSSTNENSELTATGAQDSSVPLLQPQQFWILGAGHFGRLAAKRLSRRFPEASFLVIDHRPDRLEEIEGAYKLPVSLADATNFLNTNDLSEDLWIIPAVPVHVAFLWLLHQLQHSGPVHPMPVPDEVDAMIPNPYRVSSGTVYASFATFRCPDACSEPDDLCTHTRRPRLGSLFEHLARLQVRQYHMEVIRSWQLAPGVGGYRVAQLCASLERIERQPTKYLIATSCRCHAVIDALIFQGGRRTLSQ
jgi:hypothetical protein